MPESGRTIAWILDQLKRLDCGEITLTAQPGARDGLFTRGDESLRLRLSLAHRVLFPLLTRSGDEVVWMALLRARHTEANSPKLGFT